MIKIISKNKESSDMLYSLTPLELELHKTLQDIENWVDKWKDYKEKNTKKVIRQLVIFCE